MGRSALRGCQLTHIRKQKEKHFCGKLRYVKLSVRFPLTFWSLGVENNAGAHLGQVCIASVQNISSWH